MGIQFKKPAAPAEPVQSSAPTQKPPVEDHLDPPWKEESPVSAAVAVELPVIKVEEIKTVYNPDTKVKTVTSEKHKDVPLPPVSVAIPADKLGSVSVGASRTINLGNWESAKCSVHLSLPTHVDKLDETFKKTIGWVEAKMAEALGEAAANPTKGS